MAVTREMIEGKIAAKMAQGKTRQQAIDKLLKGAKKGAAAAEKEVTLAQDALLRAKEQAEIDKLNATIAKEGRLASNEGQSIAILNQIAEDDKKKQ